MRKLMLTVMAMMMAMGVMAQHNVMYISDFEIAPGSQIDVPLMLANSDPTRGVQFNMTLPDGLTLINRQMTPYAEVEYEMKDFGTLKKAGYWLIGMYPVGGVCFPPGDTAIMILTFASAADFTGGEIILWRQRGSTIDNKTIFYDNDTTTVTIPQASILERQDNALPLDQRFYNLNGQPVESPDTMPLAIQVTTWPDGRRTSRKVAVMP